MTNTTLLEVAGVVKSYSGKLALDGVNLKVDRGEVVCVIGPSGCGKSTLLRCINWLQAPDAGEVVLNGEVVGHAKGTRGKTYHARDIYKLRSRIGMVFQQFNVWPHLSVLENVSRAQMVVLKRSRAEADQIALRKLEQIGLAQFAQRNVASLSGGQQQRVAIVRALAMDPLLMLMDEPTSALDPEAVNGILNILMELAADGMTMIVVTHELGFAARVADRLVFMDGGKIIEAGPPQQLLHAPTTDRLKQFLRRLEHLNPFQTHNYQSVV